MSDSQELMTARQAARMLGISVSTLSRIEQAGDLRPYRTPGGHRRYSRDMLLGYLERSVDQRQGAHNGR